MKISAPEEYGLRCLLCIAESEGSLTIPEIASAEGLSAPYVAKLLSVLRQGGFIDSVRGRSGGYHLACPPEEIRIGVLLMTLGEPLFDDPGYCERHAGTETNGHCVHHGDCSLRALWQTLEHWIRGALDQLTLADLMQGHGQIVDLLRSRLAEAVVGTTNSLITLEPMAR